MGESGVHFGNRYTCCHAGCFAVVCFSEEEDRRLRRTQEWWFCQAGHRQHFSGKTPEQKQIDALERDVRRLGDELQQQYDDIETLRTVYRTCPVCLARSPRRPRYYVEGAAGYIAAHREWLVAHLRDQHGVTERRQIPIRTGAGA